MDIHDGRKIFFNTASNLTQCKESGNNALVGKLPTLTSVSMTDCKRIQQAAAVAA